MLKVFNLIDNREAFFGDSVTPLEAVTQAYCEENNLMSAWFLARHAGGNFYKFSDTLPVTHGKVSICCGDWACFIG